MVARLAGAGLGFLAFSVSVLAGLYVQNPVTLTLSRGILALFVFTFMGLVLGAVAQAVIRDYGETRNAEIKRRYADKAAETNGAGPEDGGRAESEAPRGS